MITLTTKYNVSLTSILASLPAGLIPIDVFIVGYMKNATGHFQPWASDPRVRQDISTTVICAYYGNFAYFK